MKTNPKQLTEEELFARKAAREAFDLKPYLDRLVKVLSADWDDNDLGGIAVDIAKAWMAADCPHDENFHREIKCLLDLIRRLTEKLRQQIGADRWTEAQLAIDEEYDPADEYYREMPPLYSIMSEFCWAYLVSYRPCYRDTVGISAPEREILLDYLSISDTQRARELHRIALEKNCPYDPARVDEQKFADLLFLESLGRACDDAREIARSVGLQLGREVFEAYPECATAEEYRYVTSHVCDGVRDYMMREFADSKLKRMDRVTPMDLRGELRFWADTEISILCRQNGKA